MQNKRKEHNIYANLVLTNNLKEAALDHVSLLLLPLMFSLKVYFMLLSVLPGRTEKGAEYLLDMLQEEFSQVWLQTQSTRFGWQRQLLTKKEKDLMSSQFKHVRDQRIFQNPTEHFASQKLLKRLLLLKLAYNTFIFSREREQQESCFLDTTTIYYTLYTDKKWHRCLFSSFLLVQRSSR